MNSLSAAISGVGGAIGRYFSIVSFIPSLLLTGLVFALIESGAWSEGGSLDWARVGSAFASLGNLALLILISITLGVAIHPVQFALVQLFEGYWGAGRWAQRARVARILHHRRKYLSYIDHPGLADMGEIRRKDQEAVDAAEKFERASRKASEATIAREKAAAEQAAKRAQLDPGVRVSRISIADEVNRLAASYPLPTRVGLNSEYDDIMPTRLGNALRKHERQAGAQYGLNAVSAIQHLSFVAPAERLNYISDQRQLLDLSVRMSATSLVATVISITALWRHGPWLLLALAPYGVAYLSYRGAVVVANEYGAAIAAMIDLDRFALYDSLRLPRPPDTAAERRMNAKLMKLLTNDPEAVVLRYAHPDAVAHADEQSAGP